MADSLRAVVADLLVELRSRPQDTGWSSFDDENSLISEVERLASLVEEDEPSAPESLWLLFAPTGALQETALSSGWHDEYMALAQRFDALR